MRVRADRESLAVQRQNAGSAFLWILVVLAAAGLAWLWWNAAKTSLRKNTPPAAPARQQIASSNAATQSATMGLLVVNISGFPRPVQTVFEAQLALDRLGISSGSLDGRIGSQTRAALRAFQKQSELPATGELD